MRLHNPVRIAAVICVAVTTAYIMVMGIKLTNILASPGWCGKALQAEKISSQNFGGLTACVDLLKIQLNALARANLVYAGVIALCLLVLIVIVIAGGKVYFKASESGVEGNIGKDVEPLTPEVAAKQVATAATNKASDIADQTGHSIGGEVAPPAVGPSTGE